MKRYTTTATRCENAITHLHNAFKVAGIANSDVAVEFCKIAENANRVARVEANAERYRSGNVQRPLKSVEPMGVVQSFSRQGKRVRTDVKRADYYAAGIRKAIAYARQRGDDSTITICVDRNGNLYGTPNAFTLTDDAARRVASEEGGAQLMISRDAAIIIVF